MYKEVPGLLDPQDLWDVFMFSETLEFINGAPSPDFLKTTRFFFFFFFLPRCVAYGILVPRPGIEPKPTEVKVPSPHHWTAREFPYWVLNP